MASHVVLKEQLIEMGFEDKLITGALSLLKDKATLESVIESIENGTAEVEATKLSEQPQNQESTQTKESSPEELEAKKKAIEEKIKQRRMEIEEKEKEAERIRELKRREEGKNMTKMRDELDKIQREKFAESLRREKDEAKAARDAILRKIEQDKAERRARLGGSDAATTVASAPGPAKPATIVPVAKDGKTKLAIRLADGTNLIQEFDAKEVLSSVRAYIVTQKEINYNITLSQPPNPPYNDEDFEKPLFALGLVPNARLQVVKRNV